MLKSTQIYACFDLAENGVINARKPGEPSQGKTSFHAPFMRPLQLTSGVRIDSGGRIPIRKNGKQGQVALSPSYEHYLEGYFHRKNFKSSTVEVPLILKPNVRKGAEAILDLSAYPQRCRKPDTVIIHKK